MRDDDDTDARRTAVDKVVDVRMGESDRALLILDMGLSRVRGSDAVVGAEHLVRFIQGELRYFRERGRFVVFANGSVDNLGADVVIPELTPRSDEIRLSLSAPSAFFGTDLDRLLQKHGVRRLTLVGVETHTAVLLTGGDALARGYEVVVPEPCVCANDVVAHDTALRLLRTSSPRRSTAQVSAARPATDTTMRHDF